MPSGTWHDDNPMPGAVRLIKANTHRPKPLPRIKPSRAIGLDAIYVLAVKYPEREQDALQIISDSSLLDKPSF